MKLIAFQLLTIASLMNVVACRTGQPTGSSVKDEAAVERAPITIVDDHGSSVALPDLKDATSGDGSTIYTFKFSGPRLSDLQVAILVWNASFGADYPHSEELDAGGVLRGAAGRLPIFDTDAHGGRFQIIANEAGDVDPALVPDTVAALANAMNVHKIGRLRGKTIVTRKFEPEDMLKVYNVKAHPQAHARYKIKLLAKASEITPSVVIATVAKSDDIVAFILDKMTASTNSGPSQQEAKAAIQTLLDAGCILGFDGTGRDSGGNKEVYLLVLHPRSGTVYSAETAPLEL